MKNTPRHLFALAVFLLIFPLFLTRRPRVVRRILLRAKPPEIFPYLNDLRNWPLWTEWARRDEVHFSYDGAPAGVGAIQRWESSRTNGKIRIVHSALDERVTYDLDMGNGRYKIDGVLALEPIGEYTRVTWLCKWSLNPNPYRRYFDLFLTRMMGHDFAAGLENLKDLVENRHRAAVPS